MLFASLAGALFFAGCSTTPSQQSTTDYQVESLDEQMMGGESMMQEESSEVSNSTELSDIEKELQSTTISEEDFSDL